MLPGYAHNTMIPMVSWPYKCLLHYKGLTNAFMLNETSKKATEKSSSDTVTFGQSKFWKQALRDCSLSAHISLGEQCFHPLNPIQNM